MGKGLDTCLVVKQLIKSSVAQLDVDIAEKKKKLLQLTSLNVQPQPREGLARQETAADLEKQISGMVGTPDDESFPLFHLLPEMLQHPSTIILLPSHLKSFLHRLNSPEECLRTSRDITIAAYEGALNQLGEARAVVCVLPPELMEDAEIQPKALWEGMMVVRPWYEMPTEITAMEPEVLDADVLRVGDRLDDDQKEVLTELQAIVEIAEFIHFWARQGCILEIETDYEP